MEQKVKILSKYSIDAIDYDFEKKKAEARMKDRIEALGVDLAEVKKINAKKKKTEEDELILASVVEIEKEYSTRMDEISQYKELIVPPVPETTDLDQAVPYYEEKDGKVEMLWEVTLNEPTRVVEKIDSLKKSLSDGDYKITKCYEASLLKKELPYDLETLSEERNKMREEINRLEALLPSDVKTVKL
jgi:hypothetical protein